MAADINKVKAALTAKGVTVNGLGDEELIAIARALKIKTPRKVEIVEYVSRGGRKGNYFKTEVFPYNGGDGKEYAARNLFVPAVPEILEAMIEDLQQGLGLLKK